jgi:hypothetical protein
MSYLQLTQLCHKQIFLSADGRRSTYCMLPKGHPGDKCDIEQQIEELKKLRALEEKEKEDGQK